MNVSDWRLQAPVVFLIFNRLDTTKRVFEAIRCAQPKQLLVVADGPRPSHADDSEKCAATRSVIDQVDWDCEILTNFAETNLGCARRVSSGLDWVFDIVEEAIILEDDCLPHPTFFRFCVELLRKYRDDERVMAIGGVNFQFGRQRSLDSYYFSRYNHCWGWASWRRAWRSYDHDMKLWPTIRDGDWLETILNDRRAINYWTRIFQSVYNGGKDSWAYRWLFASWVQSGLTVLPNVNLISNIGFGLEATHTAKKNEFANMDVYAMDFPLHHPDFVLRDNKADFFTQRTHFDRSDIWSRFKRRMKIQIKRLLGLWI